MAENQTTIEEPSVELNSRPIKRRKFYRKRGDDSDLIPTDNNLHVEPKIAANSLEPLTIGELVSRHGDLDEGDQLEQESLRMSTAEVLRQRRAIHRKRLGIEFTNASTGATPAMPENSDALTEKDDTTADIKSIIDRFAPQMGQVADVDKHM